MSVYEGIVAGKEKISLIGLGYVGMPIAVSFARKAKVLGFDVNKEKIALYESGVDPTKEVGDEAIQNTTMEFTSDASRLKEAKFHIVAVPTPIKKDKTPDLSIVEAASRTVGRNMVKGSIVVYESTVYPGVTEDICIPILEVESGMKCGVDFKVGFSPERINPGDKVNRLETIVKVVSGCDEDSLEEIAKVYELVVEAGVHRAASIRVAEAAKVIENAQRDINIAFMNELSIIFNRLGIDTKSVLEAAKTKWNFLNFYPGLVGGHCIGVDPYYLTYKASQHGYHPEVLLSGRRINDEMGRYVAQNIIKQMIKSGQVLNEAKVAIFGFTFKENCPDTRNTRIIELIEELNDYGVKPVIYDPVADAEEAYEEYGIKFETLENIKDIDTLIIAVSHYDFMHIPFSDYEKLFKNKNNNQKVIVDVKGILNRQEVEDLNYNYWRL